MSAKLQKELDRAYARLAYWARRVRELEERRRRATHGRGKGVRCAK